MDIVEIIKVVAIIIGGGFGLWQYYGQIKLNQAKNLDDLWRKFYEDKNFVELFDLMDRVENNNEIAVDELRKYSSELKLKFLAYLSELLIFHKNSWYTPEKIDKEAIQELFQWHFYYVYFSKNTKYAFWYNLVDSTGENKKKLTDIEIEKDYWKSQYLFAKKVSQKLK